MSKDNKPVSRSNFAGRLLDRVMSERKIPSQQPVTTGEATKYATEQKEEKKVATTIQG